MRLLISIVAIAALLACQPSDSIDPNSTDSAHTDVHNTSHPAGCGDGLCDTDEDTINCVVDCGSWCGDGACNGQEVAELCPQDCLVDSQPPSPETCGNGTCDPGESSTNCATDCGSWCGDDTCNGAETTVLCPQDCGAAVTPGAVCGDGTCEQDESTANCPKDCGQPPPQSVCGDGDCQDNENTANCPQDCGQSFPPPSTTVNANVHGFVDSVNADNGGVSINGWTCHLGQDAPIEVHVFAGGDVNSGTLLKTALANAPSEQAVNTACQAGGTHRYHVTLSAAQVGAHAGEAIHVYGVSLQGSAPLSNTGKFHLPGGAPPTSTGPVAQWSFHGKIAGGEQSDAVRGPDNRVHLIADRYAQFDVNATKVVDEAPKDGDQGFMSFPPAIAVGDDNTVHIVTRQNGGWNSGYQIRYRRRNAQGSWDQDYIFGSKVKRNYVVGVAWAGPNKVYMSHSQGGSDVWGNLHIFKAGGNGSAAQIGSIGGIWRGDSDSRMRGVPGRVFLVSGNPNGGGKAAYTLRGSTDGDVVKNLKNKKTTHIQGNGRTGFPDLAVDGTDTVHVTYGAHQTVYYNKFNTAGQQQFGGDKQIFSSLNAWHLSSGLSAVGASDDGNKVLAVALRSDGGKTASKSDLLWAYSTDGGNSWSNPQDTGHNTEGGEGRCRPRIVAIGNKFFVFYRDKQAHGISLATISL